MYAGILFQNFCKNKTFIYIFFIRNIIKFFELIENDLSILYYN